MTTSSSLTSPPAFSRTPSMRRSSMSSRVTPLCSRCFTHRVAIRDSDSADRQPLICTAEPATHLSTCSLPERTISAVSSSNPRCSASDLRRQLCVRAMKARVSATHNPWPGALSTDLVYQSRGMFFEDRAVLALGRQQVRALSSVKEWTGRRQHRALRLTLFTMPSGSPKARSEMMSKAEERNRRSKMDAAPRPCLAYQDN